MEDSEFSEPLVSYPDTPAHPAAPVDRYEDDILNRSDDLSKEDKLLLQQEREQHNAEEAQAEAQAEAFAEVLQSAAPREVTAGTAAGALSEEERRRMIEDLDNLVPPPLSSPTSSPPEERDEYYESYDEDTKGHAEEDEEDEMEAERRRGSVFIHMADDVQVDDEAGEQSYAAANYVQSESINQGASSE
jgi:hypothetical protein